MGAEFSLNSGRSSSRSTVSVAVANIAVGVPASSSAKALSQGFPADVLAPFKKRKGDREADLLATVGVTAGMGLLEGRFWNHAGGAHGRRHRPHWPIGQPPHPPFRQAIGDLFEPLRSFKPSPGPTTPESFSRQTYGRCHCPQSPVGLS